MRRLIVNADDFGMTRGINRAIVEGAEMGIVTSTTLMATARAFDDAIAQASQLASRVSIGCHVILLDGTPALPPERVSSLLDPGQHGTAPEFRIKLNDFVRAAFFGKLNPAEVEAEAVEQMRRLLVAGIELSHFDCHKHAHMFPAVLGPL
ncbi:MAG TPA: ChbG/HpnK family deacetylase, partial [Candidatus Angelobacter sp.]|nr:ChbG/HpnK family deacetylase [Candidatus Angelobacter sp.]